jgi:hypothetical protein
VNDSELTVTVMILTTDCHSCYVPYGFPFTVNHTSCIGPCHMSLSVPSQQFVRNKEKEKPSVFDATYDHDSSLRRQVVTVTVSFGSDGSHTITVRQDTNFTI